VRPHNDVEALLVHEPVEQWDPGMCIAVAHLLHLAQVAIEPI
jgi:hypothetical protein